MKITNPREKALLALLDFAGCPVPRLDLIRIAARESGIVATQSEWFESINAIVHARRALRVRDNWLMAA